MVIKNRNGQMKIQQMAFMLIAVTILFTLVGLFIIKIVFSGVQESAESLRERDALLLVSKMANSPEFSCGKSLGDSRVNCVDMDKAMALSGNIGKYSDFWGVEGIEIRRIFPEGNNVKCNLDNYPDCNEIEFLSSDTGTGVSNFVALCRKDKTDGIVQEKCEIGKIIVNYDG
ncbi:MAG TPA: hypothetical protein ENH99_02965 [Candidatus Pacearchaeota archaeon]|nr:hypothetical protein [Candidatus Pacearchaeota archaeon]